MRRELSGLFFRLTSVVDSRMPPGAVVERAQLIGRIGQFIATPPVVILPS